MPKTYRPSFDHARLGRLLRDAREAAGLTQRVLASRLKRAHSYVAKNESGDRRVSIEEFLLLADAVKADPAKLMAEISKMLADAARPASSAAEEEVTASCGR